MTSGTQCEDAGDVVYVACETCAMVKVLHAHTGSRRFGTAIKHFLAAFAGLEVGVLAEELRKHATRFCVKYVRSAVF